MNPITKIIIANRINNFQTQAGQQTSVDGPFLVMNLPFIPSAASFSVLIMLANLSIDKVYKIRVKFYRDGDNDKILFDSGETSLGPFNQSGMIDIDNLNLDMFVQNVAIYKEGMHTIELSVNDSIEKESFIVNHRPFEVDQ